MVYLCAVVIIVLYQVVMFICIGLLDGRYKTIVCAVPNYVAVTCGIWLSNEYTQASDPHFVHVALPFRSKFFPMTSSV